jgi:hypothetical protein
MCSYSSLFPSLLLVVLGFELRALPLLGRALLLGFTYFSDRASCFLPSLALDPDPPTYTSHVIGTTGVCHHAQLFL